MKKKILVTIIVLVLSLLGFKEFAKERETIEFAVDQLSDLKSETVDLNESYEVVRISDGDTIVVDLNGKEEKVRLIGINAPEIAHGGHKPDCYSEEAHNEAIRILENQKVSLEFDESQSERDKFGRLLAYVYRHDGLFVNQHLLEQGFVREVTYNGEYKYIEEFKEAEGKARLALLGLWDTGVCKPELVV